MGTLTTTIEAILFASGKAVALVDIADKLGVSVGEVQKAIKELHKKYDEESGIRVLEFNKKAQLGTNPVYKDAVSAVLNPIREKELTRTLLECAAIIAYKQPVTRTEIELLRGLNSDYAVNALLDLNLIYACGRKDAVGHPVLFATTDEFLKRFKLSSLADLPDYDALMAALRPDEEDKDNYLYAREEYGEIKVDDGAEQPQKAEKKGKREEEDDGTGDPLAGGGYDIPDFLRGLDDSDLVKIS